jgi:hypothetical protein
MIDEVLVAYSAGMPAIAVPIMSLGSSSMPVAVTEKVDLA